MPKQSAVNLDITNNADGFDISGGVIARKLTVTGGDVAIAGAGSATITFPTTSTTVAGLSIAQTFTSFQNFSSGISSNGVTGTINTAAQPNITSLGSLTTLTTAGLTSTQRVTISSGGLSVAGNIDGTIGTAAQPNITSLGSLTTLTTAGLTSTQRVTISAGGLSVAGNIDGTIGTAAQPNITSLGTLTSLNTAGLTSTQRVTISSGGLSVAGNIDGTIGTAAQPNITSVGVLNGLSVNNGLSVTGSMTVTGGLFAFGGIAGIITSVTPAQPNITSLGSLTTLTTAGLTSTQTVNVSSGGIVVQAGGLSVTGGMSVTGSIINFSSSNTTTSPVTINAPSLIATSNVGALAINSPEPDIYLNDTNGGWATIIIADQGTERLAFGKNNANDFYLAVRDPSVIGGAWRDEAFVVDSSTGISRFGFPVGISGALNVENGLTLTGGLSVTGGATFGGQVNMVGNTLYQPTLRYYNEPTSSPTISAGTLTLDLSAAQIFTVSLNAAITTLSITNTPATASRAIGFTLIFTADGTARSVTWGGSILWPSGTAPTLTSTNNKRDAFSFITTDGGTTWLGFVGGQNF